MANTITESFPTKNVLRFKARVENGIIIPDEAIAIPSGQTYLVTLELEPELETDTTLDALAEIATMAQPLGPADLARNFDTYTDRIIIDEPTG